ncbi:hypothetical protein BTVI_74743 [Pitangus sulphuratus]|nr:hypothetical protein BTVI_74743 [Pitangus sulphuratus]
MKDDFAEEEEVQSFGYKRFEMQEHFQKCCAVALGGAVWRAQGSSSLAVVGGDFTTGGGVRVVPPLGNNHNCHILHENSIAVVREVSQMSAVQKKSLDQRENGVMKP